ncbi:MULTISPECIES: hypothetical protein [unclassified Mesorhizobium]|uniref:hypothetical protein n=1 Tax=unclassified Mesorhizobium TaxID=325217 RepID=UPI00301459D7
MSTQPSISDEYLAAVRAKAAGNSFKPKGTVRCLGEPLFRSQLARDLACLLDTDPDVQSWSCLPIAFRRRTTLHVPDFLVEGPGEVWLHDAASGVVENAWIAEAVRSSGRGYQSSSVHEIQSGFRLENSRDLLRYARWQCPLGDRIRLLAALDEQGSLTFAECLPVFHETRAIAGLASLILHRFVEADLDGARIGPETTVRRCRS